MFLKVRDEMMKERNKESFLKSSDVRVNKEFILKNGWCEWRNLTNVVEYFYDDTHKEIPDHK